MITSYLKDIGPGDKCCIIGASTIELILEALNKGVNVTIIDFSRIMIDAAREFLGNNSNCEFICRDILSPISLGELDFFQYVISDRLINRFTRDETSIFFDNITNLFDSSGEVRTVVKMGRYELDKKIISYQKINKDSCVIYNEKIEQIDFSRAEKALYEIPFANGSIPKEILVKWYVKRGQESRYQESILKEIIETSKQRYIKSVEKVNDNTDSLYYKVGYRMYS